MRRFVIKLGKLAAVLGIGDAAAAGDARQRR
jgi:hypothetical protein